FGNGVLTGGSLVASEIQIGILEQRFVAIVLTFCLSQLRLKWARIDFDQHVALTHYLTLTIIYAHQLAVNAALYCHGIESGNRTKRVHIVTNVAVLYCSSGNSDSLWTSGPLVRSRSRRLSTTHKCIGTNEQKNEAQQQNQTSDNFAGTFLSSGRGDVSGNWTWFSFSS